MAVAAFWFAVAAFIVVGALNARRGYELKHETIRLMLEKGEKIDDALLRDLVSPPKWHTAHPQPIGAGYTAMRVIGTMLLFAAPGIALLVILAPHGQSTPAVAPVGAAIGILVLLLGIGLHVACRFVTPPPARDGRQ